MTLSKAWSRLALGACCVGVACADVTACSSPSLPPGIRTVMIPQPEGGTVTPTDGGAHDGTTASDATTTSDAPLGSLPTVDEPNVPCVMTTATKTTLFSAGDAGFGGPGATLLANLGSARLGTSFQLGGYFTFDATGASPAFYQVLGSFSIFGSEGSTVGGFAIGGESVEYQRYDTQGIPVGDMLTLGTASLLPDGLWSGSGGGQSIALWSVGGAITGAGINTSGASTGAPWSLSKSAIGAAVAIAYASPHFAIVWSEEPTPTTTATYFVLADPSGPIGSPVPVESGTTAFVPVAVTQTPTGFALLAQGAGGDNHLYVVPLDSTGKVVPPARRLLGSDAPWDIAAFGTQLGIVVSGDDIGSDSDHGSRQPLFRPLDATGHPLGPWVCLDAPVSPNLEQDMAILNDTNGYSVIFKSASNEEVLTRVDALGTGGQ